MRPMLLMLAFALSAPSVSAADSTDLSAQWTTKLAPQVVAWRRDIHQHPELSNREFRTSALVAKQLQALGLEVRTGIAHTGVVALLKGGNLVPGSRSAPTWMRCQWWRTTICRSSRRCARSSTARTSA